MPAADPYRRDTNRDTRGFLVPRPADALTLDEQEVDELRPSPRFSIERSLVASACVLPAYPGHTTTIHL